MITIEMVNRNVFVLLGLVALCWPASLIGAENKPNLIDLKEKPKKKNKEN